jgi:hypothetical protein
MKGIPAVVSSKGGDWKVSSRRCFVNDCGFGVSAVAKDKYLHKKYNIIQMTESTVPCDAFTKHGL